MAAKNNRTITISEDESATYRPQLHRSRFSTPVDVLDRVICSDMMQVLPDLPSGLVDMVVLDPPYNLTKTFRTQVFRKREIDIYAAWVASWMSLLPRILKPTASVYFCADWRMGAAIVPLLEQHFILRNRITWEREKGRGAAQNWKNCAEDIWFATMSDDYTFNVDAVKLKRRVLAPYRDSGRQPKDWGHDGNGAYRNTSPSNLWTDITVPFWSMPENTEHPTQKPEKLLAKLLLASTNEGDVVLDPFLGSGATAVVARKLNRRFVGIEIDEHYCCLALKRLSMAEQDRGIQGFSNGVFWERNTLAEQLQKRAKQHGRSTKRS